jgi:hypothetical protein
MGKHTFVRVLLILIAVLTLISIANKPAIAGSIVGWGDNSWGQATPPAGNNFIAIAAGGEDHSLALKSNGSIIAWGDNSYGQATPPVGNNFIALAAGGGVMTPGYSLALKSDGSIVGWGNNYYGQASPPAGNNFIAIAAGGYHSLALKSDGSIIAWGGNGCGETTPPVGNNFIAIAAGFGHSLALKSDGSIVGWGCNLHGQATPPAGNNFIAIAAGCFYSLALKSDGSIVGWGENNWGQATPPAGNNFVAIAAGTNVYSLALKSDGSVVIWGFDHPTPPSGNDYIAISAGAQHFLGLKGEAPYVTISPTQNYIAATKTLSIYAIVTDSFYGNVTTGTFTWILKDSAGNQKANGNLTYNSSSSRWTGSQVLSTALSSGNYIVYYNVTTNRGRTASATGYIAVESTFNLSGMVTSSGAALASVEVIVAGRTTSTNSQGYYSFTSLDASQASTITATKSGYTAYTANLNPPSAGTTVVHDIAMYPVVVGKPVITGLMGKYSGIFVAGIPATDDYTASVNWNGTPGTVEFYTNNTLIDTVPGSSGGATATFDMGTDFTGIFSPNANKVRVVARNGEGGVSELFEMPVVVIPLPPAAVQFTRWFSVQSTDSEVHLALDFDFPDPGIKQTIDLPVIGKFGAEIAANASFDYTVGDGDWEAAFGVGAEGKQGKRGRRPTIPGLTRYPKMKLYIGNKEISGSIGGGTRGTATITDGITFDEVFATGEISAKLELGRVGLLDVIPGLSTAVSYIPGLSDLAKTISIIIYVEPEVGGEITFDLDPQFAFKSLELSGDIGLEAAYEPDLGICEMRLYVGGKPGVTFQVPGDLIKELRFKAYAGAEFSAWLITIGPIEYVFVNITIPAEPQGLMAKQVFVLVPAVTNKHQPRPIDRSYLSNGPSRFVVYENKAASNQLLNTNTAQLSPLEAFREIGRKNKNTTKLLSQTKEQPISILQADLPLIENVFPFSQPALAATGQELMLLYVSDNGGPGELQFTDIDWLRYDGTNWSTPAAIATDTRAEFAPKVAFDGDGNAVAVWQRVKDPDFDTVDINAMAAQMEIVSSRWDRATDSWTIPDAITDNNYLDGEPLLAGPMGDGSLLAVWVANENNRLVGDINHPSKLLWTRWNPTTHIWAAPQILEPNLVGLLSQSFSGAGNKTVYGWTQDMDGDLNTPYDQELFIRQFNDPNWDNPIRLTDDNIPDCSVRVAVSESNDLYLVWQQATDLVMDHNLTGISLVRENSGTVAFTDYTMTFGPAGNLILIWQEQSKEGVDAYYRVYDPACVLWSEDKQIFTDSSLERSFALVWDDVGNLTVAYNRVDIQLTNKMVDIGDNNLIEINDVPTPGQVDLAIFKRVITKDLAIDENDLTAEGSTYLPGDEIKLIATIHNTGDLGVQDVNVAFYDGDPNVGGIEVNRQTISGWLPGAQSKQVETVWRIPEPAVNHQIFAVIDPNNEISEFDETNNKLSLNISGTDLVPKILSAKTVSDGSARVIAEVYNGGAPSSPETVLAITKGTQLQTPTSTISVPSLQPGRLAQVAIDLPPGTVLAGENLFTIIADYAEEANDIDIGNNSLIFAISGPILGDLDGSQSVSWPDLVVFASQWLNDDCNEPNWCLCADFEHNGDVNFVDFSALAGNWSYQTTQILDEDFDFDGVVGISDLNRLMHYWLNPCVGPIWCEGSDIDESSLVDFVDFASFANHWLEGI